MSDSPLSLLRRHLQRAEERALFHALPHQIAHALRLPPRLTLETLVEALFQGDVVLHWEVHCPACGHIQEASGGFAHARHDYTCPACQTTFPLHLDHEVQVTFSPHPQRRVLGPAADDPSFREAMRRRFPPTTVHELMTVQAFRDWARDEPLPAGEYLEVQRLVIWFSDLTGSTALYARQGDPLAYHLVREHFDQVFDAVHQAQGVVVKTMGDGVMAVFLDGEQALRAALAAHRALADFNRHHALRGDQRLALKIGLHQGPAIVVTLNDRLDYFGTTVNVAARVSALARSWETVFTEAILADPAALSLLAAHAVEDFRTPVRGLTDPLLLYRLRFSGAQL